MTAPVVEWGDARLDAAFAARAAAGPAAPSGLIDGVVGAIATTPRSRPSIRAWVAAAATVVVAVGVVGATVLTTPQRITPGPLQNEPSRPANGGVPGSSVAAALGEPIAVAQAIAIRDADPTDREIVVHGFQTGWRPVPCPAPFQPPNPTRIECPYSLAWVVPTRENAPPNGVAPAVGFHASYDTVEPGFANDPDRPVEVELVGHFHDRRAALCPPNDVVECGRTFLVDRVRAVNGGQRAITTLRDPGTTIATEADIDGLVRAVAPNADLLARQVRTADGLRAAEPALRGDAGFGDAKLIWIETVVDLRDGIPVARTFVVVDGRIEVTEVTPAGPVDVAPAPTASPIPVSSDELPLVSPGVSNLRGWIAANTIDVAAAIDLRNHALSDRELAVEGWARGLSGFISCPMIRPDVIVAPQCPNGFVWISEAQPPPVRNNAIAPPEQPAFNLFLTGETAAQVSIARPDAIQVIALGHFDDPRAAFCTTSPVETCRKSFVVDALLDPANLDPGPTVNPTGSTAAPIAGPDDVIAIATLGSRGSAAVLSVVAVPGDGLSGLIGPIASTPELTGARLVWVVEYLDWTDPETATLQTRLVIDGPAADLPNWVYVVTRDGLRRQVTIVN